MNNDIVYHYCSPDAFLGIIKNKSLWLSSTKSLNDPNDSKYFFNKFLEEIKRLNVGKNKEDVKNLLDSISILLRSPYIISFKKKDDLNMWRAYSLLTNGFSIGFNKRYFKFDSDKYLEPNYKFVRFIDWADLKYKENDMDQLISYFADKIVKEWNPSERLSSPPKEIFSISKLNMMYKDPAFKEEEETRIIFRPNLIQESKLIHEYPLKFRITQNKLISYYELLFSEEKEGSPISEIWIGPNNESKISEISLLLEAHKYSDIKIRKSNIKFSL